MKQAHIFISGFVQGVGYRYFVKNNARKLGLTGWVRNLPDGRVEAILQSSSSSDQEGEKAIEQMIALCRKGPFLAEVRDLEVTWEETNERCKAFDVV